MQTFTVKPAPLPGEEGPKWNPATWVVRAGGAWTGAVGYSTLFCALPCILGCTLLAGEGEGASRERGRAPAAGRPPPALAAHCAGVAAATGAAAGGLGCGPGQRPWLGRGCGPCLPTPGTGPRPEPAQGRPAYPGTLSPGSHQWTRRVTLPFVVPGSRRCPGRVPVALERPAAPAVLSALSRAGCFSRKFTAGDLLLRLTFLLRSG